MTISVYNIYDILSYTYDSIFNYGLSASDRQKLIFYIKKGDYKKVTKFVDSGILLNFRVNSDTPLALAVESGDKKMVSILLNANKTGINIPDIFSHSTPLIISCQKGDYEITKLLLNGGANPYLKDEIGCDAFCNAHKFSNHEIVSLLGEYIDAI